MKITNEVTIVPTSFAPVMSMKFELEELYSMELLHDLNSNYNDATILEAHRQLIINKFAEELTAEVIKSALTGMKFTFINPNKVVDSITITSYNK